MIVELICGLAIFGTGTAVGRTLERLDLAKRNRVEAEERMDPKTSKVTMETDMTGHIRASVLLTATDFLEATARMSHTDRRYVLGGHNGEAHVLNALFLLFRHLPGKGDRK
jgi:hypothetical protein